MGQPRTERNFSAAAVAGDQSLTCRRNPNCGSPTHIPAPTATATPAPTPTPTATPTAITGMDTIVGEHYHMGEPDRADPDCQSSPSGHPPTTTARVSCEGQSLPTSTRCPPRAARSSSALAGAPLHKRTTRYRLPRSAHNAGRAVQHPGTTRTPCPRLPLTSRPCSAVHQQRGPWPVCSRRQRSTSR